MNLAAETVGRAFEEIEEHPEFAPANLGLVCVDVALAMNQAQPSERLSSLLAELEDWAKRYAALDDENGQYLAGATHALVAVPEAFSATLTGDAEPKGFCGAVGEAIARDNESDAWGAVRSNEEVETDYEHGERDVAAELVLSFFAGHKP